MINLGNFRNKVFYIVGLSLSGESIVKAMLQQQISCTVWDDNSKIRNDLANLDVVFTQPEDIDWNGIDYLLLSPGIPDYGDNTHRSAVLAKLNNVPIIADVDLLFCCDASAYFIGITGTNGKSTTTALTHYLLQKQSVITQLGGNIGIPIAELQSLPDDFGYILELSSYQLERCPHLNLNIAVLLNLSVDHLDRHITFDNYSKAKQNIFHHSHDCQHAVIGMDDEHCRAIYNQLRQSDKHKVYPVSGQKVLAVGVSCVNGTLYDNGDEICTVNSRLQGMHNYQNIAAAYAILKILNIGFNNKHLSQFKGLSHRQEFCATINNTTFINDSKATNVESCLTAIKAFGNKKNLHLIMGGVAKQDDIAQIAQYIDAIACIYLIGESCRKFADIFSKYNINYKMCFNIRDAVHEAYKYAIIAEQKNYVLLSPACASFDQYRNFNERGDDFKRIVAELASE